MNCKFFLKTLLILLWYVISIPVFNYAVYYFVIQQWNQATPIFDRIDLLETTKQLRSLCSAVEESSDAQLELALKRQRDLQKGALERNLSIPLLIYKQSSSGWGNNILGLVSTLLLAIVTNRALFIYFRPVKLEHLIHDKWGVFPDISLLATSRNMSVEELMKDQVQFIQASEHDQVWLSLTKQMERAYLDILSFDTKPTVSNVVLQSNQFFAPLLYIRKDFNHQLCRIVGNRPFYSIANKVLLLAPEIQNAAYAFMQEMHFHEKVVIGMQVRSKNNAPRWKKLNSLDRLGSTVQCTANVALQQKSSKPIVLFVATDDPNNLKQIRQLVSFNLSVFDLERATRLFSYDSADTLSAKHAFVDIFLLSRTDFMISSWGSTFGYLAHGISGQPPFSVDLHGRCLRMISSEPEMHHFYRMDNLRSAKRPYSSSIIEWMNMKRKACVVP